MSINNSIIDILRLNLIIVLAYFIIFILLYGNEISVYQSYLLLYSTITYSIYTGYVFISDVAIKKNSFNLILLVFFFSLVFVVCNNLIFKGWSGSYFEFAAVDSLQYHNLAKNISSSPLMVKISLLSNQVGLDDWGYPIFISYLYRIIESNLFVNFVNILINSVSTYLLYKISLNFLSNKYAFIGSLLYGISQMTLFYISSGLKEILMIFIIILSIYFYSQYLSTNKLYKLILSIITAVFLIFFRVPLLLFLGFAFVFNEILRSTNSFKKYTAIIISSCFLIIVFSYFEDLVFRYLMTSSELLFKRVEVAGTLGTSSSFFFFVSMISGFFGPFPSFIFEGGITNSILHSGSLMLKVILSYWFLYSSYLVFKRKNIFIIPLVLFTIFEILGLIYLSESFELRLNMPHMPFFFIISIYGISSNIDVQSKLFRFTNYLYFFLIVPVVFFWNYLRF